MPEHIRILIKYVRLIALFISLCSLVGFAQVIFPHADLFNHFRVQAVLGLSVCLIALASLRDKRGILLVALILALNCLVVGQKLWQTSGIPRISPSQAADFSIVSSNVLTSNTNFDAVLDMVSRENPDFILLTEVNKAWMERLAPLDTSYPYSLKEPSEDNFGIAAYSKVPFNGRIQYSGGAGVPILIAELENGATLIGIHPLPPSSIWSLTENQICLNDVAKLSDASDGPVIVTGDFNTTLWSSTMTPLIQSGLDRINPLGIAYTWPTTTILFAIQIDHFFARDIAAADFKVLPNIGSDHYPIRADVVFAPKEQTSPD
jgi:endonuclease/exonuclease/phosphatase (EEP) superfamily protein YafD